MTGRAGRQVNLSDFEMSQAVCMMSIHNGRFWASAGSISKAKIQIMLSLRMLSQEKALCGIRLPLWEYRDWALYFFVN